MTKDLTNAAEIADRVTRSLLSAAQYPEFGKGSVPVRVAAEVLGKDATWIQAGIITGWLPIGVATIEKQKITKLEELGSGKRANYYISPKLLWELTGFVWKGEERENV